MLLRQKSNYLVEAFKRNLIRVPGTDEVVASCPQHGMNRGVIGPRNSGCPLCQFIYHFTNELIHRDVERGEVNTEPVLRAVANACQAERAGRFDLKIEPYPIINEVPDGTPDETPHLVVIRE